MLLKFVYWLEVNTVTQEEPTWWSDTLNRIILRLHRKTIRIYINGKRVR